MPITTTHPNSRLPPVVTPLLLKRHYPNPLVSYSRELGLTCTRCHENKLRFHQENPNAPPTAGCMPHPHTSSTSSRERVVHSQLGVLRYKYVTHPTWDENHFRKAILITSVLLRNINYHFGTIQINHRALQEGDVMLFGPIKNSTTNTTDDEIAPIDFITGEEALSYSLLHIDNVPNEFYGTEETRAMDAKKAKAEWDARAPENNQEDSRGAIIRILGVRTRFFLTPTGNTVEIGIITPNLFTVLHSTMPTFEVGNLVLFERCYLNEPYDNGFQSVLPERISVLSREEFATYRPLHVAKHRIMFDSVGAGHITLPWSSDDPDPEADVMFNKAITL